MKTLVLGIGNTILGDDAVGCRVAEEAKQELGDKVDIECGCVGGLNMLDLIAGYDKVIIVDAMRMSDEDSGKVQKLMLNNLKRNYSSPPIGTHHLDINDVINIGRICIPGQMPENIVIFGIVIPQVSSVTEQMSKKIESSLPYAVDLIKEEVLGQ